MNEVFELLDNEIKDFLERLQLDIESESDNVTLKQLSRNLKKISTTLHHLYSLIKKKETNKLPKHNLDKAAVNNVVDLLSVTKSYNSDKNYRGDDFYSSYNEQLIKYKGFFDQYISLHNDNSIKKIRDEFPTEDSEEYMERIKSNLSQSKYIVDELVKEHALINNRLKNLKEQQDRVDALEKKYRSAISQVSLDEEEYRNKLSVLDKGAELAGDFLPKLHDINTKILEVEKQSMEAVDNIRTLTRFTNGYNKIYEKNLNELNSIIKQAKSVLGNATSAAVGEHFKIQYDRSKKYILLWPFFGCFFLLGAISVCVLTVFPEISRLFDISSPVFHENRIDNVPYIISRLIVSPLFLIGAWFCANQYIKQKNIVEDYGYKKVLALSLLSIKSEIEKTGAENTTEFIKALQKEILKSPLDSLNSKHHMKEAKILNQVQNRMLNKLTSKLVKKGKDGNEEAHK